MKSVLCLIVCAAGIVVFARAGGGRTAPKPPLYHYVADLPAWPFLKRSRG